MTCPLLKTGFWAKHDPYALIRPLLFSMDPEAAHNLTLSLLSSKLVPTLVPDADDPVLKVKAFGLTFSNPVGLAAGLDKQARAINAFQGFGFGAVEVGTVTPEPQLGNPLPRMFRASEAKALINRFGFNSVGGEAFAANMEKWRNAPPASSAPVGINIGKNKTTTDDTTDYIKGLERLGNYADFVTINISSPNTPGLRELQKRDRLRELLTQVTACRDKVRKNLPLLVKVAPDLTDEQQADIATVMGEVDIQGLIISNTTLARPDTIPADIAAESGGLSGQPLFEHSTQVLANIYKLTGGKVPLIGCGGIANGAQAYAKIRAGALMVQIYTSLIFEGPLVIQKIKDELAALLKRDGYTSITQAVGADNK